jgi:hypothetical protein
MLKILSVGYYSFVVDLYSTLSANVLTNLISNHSLKLDAVHKILLFILYPTNPITHSAIMIVIVLCIPSTGMSIGYCFAETASV